MRWIGATIAIAAVAGLAIALYLSIALPLLREAPTFAAPAATALTSAPSWPPPQAKTARHTAPVVTPAEHSAQAVSGSRLLEISGRVSDAAGRPLEDVLVTEERVFTSTRSDAEGNYRLSLELPRQRLPVLNYLRAGYRGERIHLTWAQLGERPAYALDVRLADSDTTRRLDGWVRNDFGVPLEGVRVTIKTRDTSADKLFYLTVFSDERGQFSLEGVHASTHYHLSAMLAPGYPVYSDPDYYLDDNAMPLDIELRSLRFVNLGGMILARDGTPVPNLAFYIKNLSTGLHRRKITSDSSGFFALEEYPLGEVSLTTRGAEFFRIRGLRITEDNYASLALVVDRGDRYLDGWVSDVNGQPLQKVMVTLESSHEADGIEYFSYRSQNTDASGRFAFADLARTEYRLAAYASGFVTLRRQYAVDGPPQPLRLMLRRGE